jgi:hypothetical protein
LPGELLRQLPRRQLLPLRARLPQYGRASRRRCPQLPRRRASISPSSSSSNSLPTTTMTTKSAGRYTRPPQLTLNTCSPLASSQDLLLVDTDEHRELLKDMFEARLSKGRGETLFEIGYDGKSRTAVANPLTCCRARSANESLRG